MWIIGCDFHMRYQQIAALETITGELLERRLSHEQDEAIAFYQALPAGALVGMEASGPARWFERLLDRCGHRLWLGNPREIRARVVRKQKTDLRDAQHLLELLRSGRFPRIWVPRPAERDARHLLAHRHKLVGWRTQVENQLHALARSEGVPPGSKIRTQAGRQRVESLALDPWAAQRRQDLLQMRDQLHARILALTGQIERHAQQRPEAMELMTQPGVGPIVSLAFVLTVGPAQRFGHGKQVVSYLGLNPSEHSSGGEQRCGHISKQGNRMMRWLLVEAAHVAARKDPDLRRVYQRLAFRRGRKIAKVAVARKLTIGLYRRLRAWQEKQAMPPAPTQGSSGVAMVNAVHSPQP